MSLVNTAVRNLNGAKFTDADVTLELGAEAISYAKTYTGDFPYLVDMYTNLSKGKVLSVPQIRGILNCLRAQILASQKAQDSKPQDSHNVPSNRYAVTIEGKLRFFKVNNVEAGKWEGWVFVEELFGSQGSFNHVAIKGKAKFDILKAIAQDEDSLARFGQELGICGMCASPLTDEESRAIGIGPVCRNK